MTMQNGIKKRIDKLLFVVDQWLRPDNLELKEAIDRTLKESLFSFEDIKYQVRSLKKSLTPTAINRWAERATLRQDVSTKTVVCLHAGNLPLVGIQDILAVALSGHHYIGKLSKKDPYLPATLLRILKKEGALHGRWNINIDEFSGERADAVMFSGSTSTAEPVLKRLKTLDIASSTVPKLIRTAHYSMALVEDDQPETMRQLVNAIFRYGGKGCRSVAMVVAPFSLNSKKCHFTDYVEEFWMNQPQHEKAPPSLYHRYAYNKAAGIEQAWLDNFLIEETDRKPVEPFILQWVKGDRKTAAALTNRYLDGLQSIYVTDSSVQLPGAPVEPELLKDAQQPPIWWTPDGTDPLNWLMKL
jgi:hypothetical protein